MNVISQAYQNIKAVTIGEVRIGHMAAFCDYIIIF